MSAEIVPFATNAPAPRPRNVEAEQALLGAVLVNNAAFHRVADRLRAEHFHEPVHGRIYEAIERLMLAGKGANPVVLKGAFEQDGALTEIGGATYLARLAASAVTIINVPDYADAIIECWRRRRLIDTAERLAESAADESLDATADAAMRAAEETFHELASAGAEGGLRPMAEAVAGAVARAEQAFKAGGRIVGLPTGFADLDDMLGGLTDTDLIIIAGRPAMGKSALAMNIGEHVARQGKPVAVFSLEMSGEQLAARSLAGETGVSAQAQRKYVGPHEMTSLIDAAARLKGLPIHIDDTAGASVGQMRARCIRLKRRHGLALVIVDYLQLVIGGRPENRVLELSAITRSLKQLAKDLNVPVIALSQLSREVERRDDKRPMLSDLRESGSIEQDADIVGFVYREEYYLEKAEPQRGDFDDESRYQQKWSAWRDRRDRARNVAELLIRKNRHGPEGVVRLHFDGARARFGNLARGI